jgi:hypothetical protein
MAHLCGGVGCAGAADASIPLGTVTGHGLNFNHGRDLYSLLAVLALHRSLRSKGENGKQIKILRCINALTMTSLLAIILCAVPRLAMRISFGTTRPNAYDPVFLLVGVSERVCQTYWAPRRRSKPELVDSLVIEEINTFDWVVAEFAKLKRVFSLIEPCQTALAFPCTRRWASTVRNHWMSRPLCLSTSRRFRRAEVRMRFYSSFILNTN